MNDMVDADKRCAGTIAICTRDSVKAGTATSWLMTDYSFVGPNAYVIRYFIQGHILTMQRNASLQEMEGDWIIFIDDDMVFQPDAIGRLVKTHLETGSEIVGGLCFQRAEPHQPTMYYESPRGGYLYREDWEEGSVVDVDATGMAFCLISIKALSKIIQHVTGDPDAYFFSKQERQNLPPPQFFQWGPRYGEDFNFCRAAKNAGCRIVVDTSIAIGHIGEHVIDHKTFLRGLALREEDEAMKRKEANDLLGLPTMSADFALTKLRAK